ncbi:MAG: hypothetical protein KJ645_13775, partial [Planctomycetes bacterium]|nr:hypothetical protein [Planctomycetota bacterium]
DFFLEAPWYLFPLGGTIPESGVLTVPGTVPHTPDRPYDLFLQGLIGLSADSLTNLFILGVR